MKRNYKPAQFTALTFEVRLETGLVSVITVLIHIAFVDR